MRFLLMAVLASAVGGIFVIRAVLIQRRTGQLDGTEWSIGLGFQLVAFVFVVAAVKDS